MICAKLLKRFMLATIAFAMILGRHACCSPTPNNKVSPRMSRNVRRVASTTALGDYTWITIEENEVTKLESWKNDIHFCPYTPASRKWIITCKENINKVSDQLSGEKIGKVLTLEEGHLSEFPWLNKEHLECDDQLYALTCEYYWKNALEKMKQLFFGRLEQMQLTAAAEAFCTR